MQVQIIYDPYNKYELEKAFDYVKKQIEAYSPVESTKSKDVITFKSANNVDHKTMGSQMVDIMKENIDLKQQLKDKQEEIEQLMKKLAKKEDDVKSVKEDYEQTKKSIQESEETIKGLKQEVDYQKGLAQVFETENDSLKSDLQAQKEEADAKYRKLQRELMNENLNKKNEIEKLKKRLAEVESDLSGEIGEIKYFDVEGDKLGRTNIASAIVRLEETKDGKAYYYFNENGPHREACQNRQKLLDPFFDILDAAEGANTIKLEKRGKATVDSSDRLVIETRAKIRLIKN